MDPDGYISDEEDYYTDYDELHYFIPSPEYDVDDEERLFGPGYDDVEDDTEYEDKNHLFENMGLFTSREDAQSEVTRIGRENNMFFAVTTTKPRWKPGARCRQTRWNGERRRRIT